MPDENFKEKREQATILERVNNLIATNKSEHEAILAQVRRTNGFVQEHEKDIKRLDVWKSRITGGLLVLNIVVLPVVFYLLFERLQQ